MASDSTEPAIEELRARLDAEEAAYADVLGALDALAGFALPAEAAPEVRERLRQLNSLWAAAQPPAGGGIGARLQRRVWRALAPALERQAAFNAALVQLVNARLDHDDRLHARLRDLAAALIGYAQRVAPLVDARTRMGTALATTRSELVLEAFGRQLESSARRLEGLAAVAARLEASMESGPMTDR